MLAGKSYCAFKPEKDTRQQNTFITTIRGVIAINYTMVSTLSDLSIDADIIVIDEAQFFGPDLVPFCQSAKDRGKVVIVSGLDMDYNRNPFGQMGDLMAIADTVTKLSAVCACGKDASYTKKISGDKLRQIEIGDQCYIPCCVNCYLLDTSTPNIMQFRSDLRFSKELQVHEKTANVISEWLNKNGFKEASLALDCQFDL